MALNTSHAAVERNVAKLFSDNGWAVVAAPESGSSHPDFVVERGAIRYGVEIKSVGEGRPDRVLASLSQAILQAVHHAKASGQEPLAIVHVRNASASLIQKVEQFQREYAPDVAVGLHSDEGGSRFIGPGLASLNNEAPHRFLKTKKAKPRRASDLFSDLNQWMLKVLLAPELPQELLTAPRDVYGSVSGLAQAANVSMMSASRFVQRTREEGFLEEGSGAFRVVRRRELFRRWQSASMKALPELKMCYLIRSSGIQPLQKAASLLDACIGLYSAADLLGIGHVSGALPQLYVRKLESALAQSSGLLPASAQEQPDVVLKQAGAPQSIFRGAVRVNDVWVCDVLQIWLDASAHPSRGLEQAEFLRRAVLANVIEGQE